MKPFFTGEILDHGAFSDEMANTMNRRFLWCVAVGFGDHGLGTMTCVQFQNS